MHLENSIKTGKIIACNHWFCQRYRLPLYEDGSDQLDPFYNDSCIQNHPGSVAFVPGVAGLIIAGEVVKDLTHINRKRI